MVSLLPEEMAVWNFFWQNQQAESSMIILWLTAFDMACVHTTHSFMSVFLQSQFRPAGRSKNLRGQIVVLVSILYGVVVSTMDSHARGPRFETRCWQYRRRFSVFESFMSVFLQSQFRPVGSFKNLRRQLKLTNFKKQRFSSSFLLT